MGLKVVLVVTTAALVSFGAFAHAAASGPAWSAGLTRTITYARRIDGGTIRGNRSGNRVALFALRYSSSTERTRRQPVMNESGAEREFAVARRLVMPAELKSNSTP
jgi:hypothetical protein